MRAVIDTSILVRSIIHPTGTVGPILSRLRDGGYTLLYSSELLEEIVEVLGRGRLRSKYGVTDQDVEILLKLFLLRGEAVAPSRRIQVCRDPKDDKVLDVAIAGRAESIVTGDEDLLVLHPFEGIPIVGPSEFLRRLAG